MTAGALGAARGIAAAHRIALLVFRMGTVIGRGMPGLDLTHWDRSALTVGDGGAARLAGGPACGSGEFMTSRQGSGKVRKARVVDARS